MNLFRSALKDGDRLDLDGVAVRLRVNPRARRIILRLDANRSEGVAVAPSAKRLPDAVAFARSRRAWLAERLAAPGTACGSLDASERSRAKLKARDFFRARMEVHCAALGVPVPTLAVSDTRSRWGSCTPPRPGKRAAIRLSWRLILAPAAVADYVVAHECAHLAEANHSPRFWAVVKRLVGDPAPHRRWLRRNGAALHLA